MLVALCLLMIAGALAQVPTTCPGPDQFEGRFQRYDRARGESVSGFFAYDHTQRRIRELEDTDTKGTKASYDRLIVYNTNIEYDVDRATKTCKVSQPRYPFRPLGVPPEAKFVREGVIGAAGIPGEEVTVAEFEGAFEGNNFTIVVTYPDCFPVRHFFSVKEGMISTTYYDLQAGISDPELFIPPKECKIP